MNDCKLVVGKPGIAIDGVAGKAANPDNEVQRKINKMMGISEEIFQLYNNKQPDPGSPPQGDIQRMINKLMGISEEVFLEYSEKKNDQEKVLSKNNLTQREINEMMGITEEVFCKHNK